VKLHFSRELIATDSELAYGVKAPRLSRISPLCSRLHWL